MEGEEEMNPTVEKLTKDGWRQITIFHRRQGYHREWMDWMIDQGNEVMMVKRGKESCLMARRDNG